MSWLLGNRQGAQTAPNQRNDQDLEVSSFLSQPLDAASLHPLSGLDQGLEFLDLEDEVLNDLPGSRSALPSRGWTDDLCYGTGAVYLAGLGLGGAYGAVEGLRTAPADAPSRIKVNSILNAVTRRGPFLGNSAGVLAMTYNGINSLLGYYRGYHDDYNSVAAGLLAGAVFRSTRGLKPMAISSGLMGGAAASWCLIKRTLV
ncbi:Tim17/Tim22/Tim23/Pmp24 family-domain-containing protein [Dipodascopsis tothii]|uniref:Tim17/Tim22/Tim23/Pmp24 family-domain-containing protein n=1 Tax=Dipodascopsis tothii TaxID=44089 RepID=UPI0034CE2B83